MTHKFKVFMHSELVDELDEGFSPLDGIIAIGQMFGELPQRHAAIAPKRSRRQPGRKLRVYRGKYDWFPLGFSYVQIANDLHVIDLWLIDEPNRYEIDVVLSDQANAIQEATPNCDPTQESYIVTVEHRTIELYEVHAQTPEDAMEHWQDGELVKRPFSRSDAEPLRAELKGDRP